MYGVWVSFFKGEKKSLSIKDLIIENQCILHPYIYGELLPGGVSDKIQSMLLYIGICDNTREFILSSMLLTEHNEYYQNVKPVSFLTKSIQYDLFKLNFSGDIYGETIEYEFISRIRDEIKFSSVDELKKQLQEDKLNTISILDKTR